MSARMSSIARHSQSARAIAAADQTLWIGLAAVAIVCAVNNQARAQFAELQQAVDSAAKPPADEESLPPGPAGPLLSPDFAVQSEELKLGPRQDAHWTNAEPNWLGDEQLVSPTLFNGQRPRAHRSTIPEVGPIHTAREWRAWRRKRRRWNDSWLFFPVSVTKFTGPLFTQEPVHEKDNNGQGTMAGVRLGWDFAPRLGVESRLAFARQALRDTAIVGSLSHENFIFWDADLLVYPWGDRPWRPFLLAGLGLSNVQYIDNSSVYWNQTLLAVPLGAGLQYRFNNRAALRLDVTDNMLLRSAAGGGARHMQHDLSITFGFQARFGPHRPYFTYPHSRFDRFKVFLPYHD